MSNDPANSGALFKNAHRQTDRHPLYTGQAVIGGASFWISAWINETEDGKKYMSLSFRPKHPAATPAEQPF